MTTIQRKAPRLFTGAVFPEEVSRGLVAFAQRHNLMSDVWVPKRLVGKVQPGITLLPNAILCDVSLMPGCGATDCYEIGYDRLLVNAAHTTDSYFFESYQSGISRGLHGALALTQFGTPQRDFGFSQAVMEGNEKLFKSPYWLRCGKKRRRWINAEETHHPGRYNPFDCTSYVPHTWTNQFFPQVAAKLMRRKASRFGYISRTWITLKEGEAHGTKIDTKRINDSPPIFVSFFSGRGDVQCVEYFCADQFEDPAVFPTRREIDLAASGVYIGAEKVRGYPLLASLAAESSSAVRHRQLAEETSKFSEPVLFGVPHNVATSVLNSGFKDSLRKFALLRGFSRLEFLLHTAEVSTQLRLKPQEQGIVYNLPVKPNASFAEQDSFCFFNAQQFEESTVVEEMIRRTPTHFFFQHPLTGVVMMECARAQCANPNYSQTWIPNSVLEYISGIWKLSSSAVGVAGHKGLHTSTITLYNTKDMDIPQEALEWWPKYTPHDVQNRMYFGKRKMLLSLRAWEQGYTSPLWVTQSLMTRVGGIARKQKRRRESLLRGKPFEKPPTVLMDEGEYINVEEIKNPEVLLASVSGA